MGQQTPPVTTHPILRLTYFKPQDKNKRNQTDNNQTITESNRFLKKDDLKKANSICLFKITLQITKKP